MNDATDKELKRAQERALRLLGVRNRSTYEVRTRLERAGFEEEVVAEVISWLHHLDYLNDERFAREWVDSRLRHKPLGRRRLTYELIQKGIGREIIEEALQQVDSQAESQLATSLAYKQYGRMREPTWESVERKIYGYLTRRGFRSDAVRQAIESLRQHVK